MTGNVTKVPGGVGPATYGNVSQVPQPSTLAKFPEQATTLMIQPTFASVREAGAPQFIQGQGFEEQGAPMVTQVRTEQVQQGQVSTNTVDIPTQEVIETVVEIP